MTSPDSVEFPMRINRYLAKKGYATRRGADELISSGRVTLNGRPAKLGDQVNAEDTVEVKSGKRPKIYRYFAYHKPRNIITHSPQHGEEDIQDALAGTPGADGLFPVGRLDKDSSGLIILTDDGRITDRLLHPSREHEKEYVVETTEPLRDSFVEHMERGVDIGDYVTKPCKVKRTGDRSFRIILGEGKKHQIRRMVDAMHNGVSTLKRVRVLNIELGKLAVGALRPIEGAELKEFLAALGLA